MSIKKIHPLWYFLLTIWLMFVAVAIFAAEPIARVGMICPTGYAKSGNYCVPRVSTTKPAVAKVTSCPSGYASNGKYCVKRK